MSQAYEPTQPAYEEMPSQSDGNGKCLLYGCLGVFIVGTLSIALIGFGIYFTVQKQIEAYTSTEPMVLPEVEYSEEELANLESRIESFRSVLETDPSEAANPSDGLASDGEASDSVAGQDGDTGDLVAGSNQADAPEQAAGKSDVPLELVLTASDINALIAKEPKLKGRLFVEIADGQVTGDISIPTDSFLPGSKGRFFNGSGTFEVALEDGVLMVTLDQAELNGKSLPESFMSGLRSQNLAKDVYKDEKNAKLIRRFDSIRVEGDTIIATLKDESEDAASTGLEGETEPQDAPGDGQPDAVPAAAG